MTFDSLLQENVELKARLSLVCSQLSEERKEKETLASRLESARLEEQRLKLVVQKLQHRLFGSSSERREGDPLQGSLFDLPQRESGQSVIAIKSHSRQVRVEFPDEQEASEGTFPAHLPRQEQIIDEKPEGIPEDDLELVSQKITERLSSTPEQHQVIRIIRRVYKQKSTGKFHTPAAPEHVLDRRCKVDETFLVLMVIKKFLWHMPLYRQQQELKLQGIPLSRDRMVVWTIEFGALFRPIAKALGGMIRAAPVVHCDETPITVGKGKKREGKNYSDGWLWPILAPEIGVAFFYRPTRAWREVFAVLENFSGTLVSDAYEGYENYVKQTQCQWQLCWMHIRRNFVEAEKSNPELAAVALDYIRELYAVEAQARGVTPDKRLFMRFQRSRPVLEQFHSWLTQIAATPAVLTDDNLSQACNYVLKRWEAACLFAYDGAVPIDNGADERAIRPVKLGAKNWLHCASEEGAETAAIFYSLIASAIMHGIHPYYYLLDLTKRLDDPTLSAEDLVPHRWKERFLEQAVPEHLRQN